MKLNKPPIFKNTPNKCYKINENGKDRLIWESRSVAINCIIGIHFSKDNSVDLNNLYILVSKRGKNAADYQGKMNLVAGYLDWNETGTEACIRETLEETGLDISYYPCLEKIGIIIKDNLNNPWNVNTDISENKQNISLRYGILFKSSQPNLPELSLDNNEVEGEVEEAFWMPFGDISKYDWAFKHDEVIKKYIFGY